MKIIRIFKSRRLLLLAICLVVVIASLSQIFFTSVTGSASQAQEENYNNGRSHITALGRLEPESRIINISGSSGTRLVSLAVREGDRVKKGDVLAYMDGYEQKLAARNRAKILLKEGEELHTAETVNGEAAIQEAELQLSQIDTISPLEIKAQQAVVNRLNGELEFAQKKLDRLTRLHEKNSASQQDVDDQKTQVLQLQEELAQEQLNLARLNASKDIDKLVAQQKLRGAKASLESAQIGTRLQSLQSDLNLAEADMEQLIIRSPINGVILKILTWPGEKIGDLPILKMGNIDQMYAVAEVYETDIQYVKTGLQATISSPALKSPLTGTVEKISPIIFKNDVIDIDPASKVDARVVEVRIRLNNSSEAAHLSNLQVDVDINLKKG